MFSFKFSSCTFEIPKAIIFQYEQTDNNSNNNNNNNKESQSPDWFNGFELHLGVTLLSTVPAD